MKTIITIKKDKPANNALILLARELAKNNDNSITIKEITQEKGKTELIFPSEDSKDPFAFFDLLSDFPTIGELRKTAWPEI